MEYPCKTCTRCKDPRSCGNKTCMYWQKWFLDRWETMREYLRRENDGT